jgi:hypothetical protein
MFSSCGFFSTVYISEKVVKRVQSLKNQVQINHYHAIVWVQISK